VNTRNFDLFREAVASDNVDHDPARTKFRGPKATARSFRL
jgi:hypothetical protein